MSVEVTASDIRLAQEELWAAGDLSWLLDENQLAMKASIEQSKNKYHVLECARRLGKSYLLCIIAVECALRSPRQRILYAAPTTKDAQEIVAPLLEQICDSAPFSIKYDKNQSKFIFPNGSQIRLFGCDNKTKANRGRGSGANLVLLDEAGFIPVLDYVLHSIVAPQTLTTRGRVILASTPSDEPDHPFTTLAAKAEEGAYYVRKTIHDNPRLSKEEIAKYIAEDAALLGFTVEEFKESDIYKREFLALRAIDTNLVVCPDWDGNHEEFPRPEFYDAYVAFDAGGVDPHGLLFGYFDFATQTLVIEDELLLRDGQNTEEIAHEVKRKEGYLWGVERWDGTLRALEKNVLVPTPSPAQPYLRVSDMGSPKLDLVVDGVRFMPTAKTEKRAQIDAVRIMFRQKKIKIHPRCRNLARHVRTTMWLNERQQSYRRTKTGEHGDLLDCLVYMVRNLRKSKDPKPLNWDTRDAGENTWVRPGPKVPEMLPKWRKMM
jgi:hypothetical protein